MVIKSYRPDILMLTIMRKDKAKASFLRRQGRSYTEINNILSVPKSTLSGWFRGVAWSDKIKSTLQIQASRDNRVKMRSLVHARGERLAKIYEQGGQEAREEFERLKYHPLFTSSICLYWGEGNKASRYNVTIGNADPLMIRVFVDFLKSICGVAPDKIRAYILIYPDLNSIHCIEYWMKNTGLTKINFTKCVTITGRHATRRVKYGVCTVGISSRYLKEKMLIWLQLLPLALTNDEFMRV